MPDEEDEVVGGDGTAAAAGGLFCALAELDGVRSCYGWKTRG